MNGVKYLVDTNCFIYLLDENALIEPFLNVGWAYSYITEIELLCKPGISLEEEKIIRNILDDCYKLNHSEILTERIIALKRSNRINLPDAIIASSAQLLELPLITADKGFSKIEGIDAIILDF